MKHKKLFVFVVVLVMALAATAAYAWWSTTVQTGPSSVTTGQVSLEVVGLPLAATDLVPQLDPALNAPDADYAHVQYFYVGNTSSIPLMFYGWLSDGSDAKNIRSHVRARIWLLGATSPPLYWTGYPAGWVDTFQVPGPHLSFDGTVADLWSGQPAGINYLSSRWWDGSAWHRTPIAPGEYGVYRVAIWLSGSAPPETQSATLGFQINFTGMQDEAWTEAGYDGIAKY